MSQILPDSKTYVIITTRSLEIEKQDCILLEKKKNLLSYMGVFFIKILAEVFSHVHAPIILFLHQVPYK